MKFEDVTNVYPGKEAYPEKERPLILKLGQKITDRKFRKVNYKDPEYYGLAAFVSDEEAKIALKMKLRQEYSIEEMMKLTKDGKALYLHCLPADISGLSCPEGEVDNSVFDRYIVPLYKQASYKPYIIAAMIFLAQVKDPVRALMEMDKSDAERKMF